MQFLPLLIFFSFHHLNVKLKNLYQKIKNKNMKNDQY